MDAPAVVREIQELSELVTVRYSIQKVIGLEEEKVPFGSEQVLLMVQGDVLGGVDLALLSTNDVQVSADDVVTARLPQPKVMHVYVDEKQTRVWDRSKTWWTPWEPFDPELEQKARSGSAGSDPGRGLADGDPQQCPGQRREHCPETAPCRWRGVRAVREPRGTEMRLRRRATFSGWDTVRRLL